MKIHALTVSVQYARWLALSMDRWAPRLASWTIVTDLNDDATANLARSRGLQLHQTDAFYRYGARFNKGMAMEEARVRCVPREDWLLLLDADIVPEPDWYTKLVAVKPDAGNLYSAWRYQCLDLKRIDDRRWQRIATDGPGVGYFQLFHSQDRHAQRVPLIPTHWSHGGAYDSELKDCWPDSHIRMLPIRLTHLGERDNWLGPHGSRAEFQAMIAERRRRKGHQHEKIQIPEGQ